jgi:RES domain-containing protein
MRFWRIASDEPGAYRADDLSGEGARRHGARWNVKGTPAVYASYHLATAVLETLAHIGRGKQPVNRYVVTIDVDDPAFNDRKVGIVEIALRHLPAGWNFNPPQVSQLFGAERFKLPHLGFAVPSSIVQEELNLVLNPLHPAFNGAVTAQITRRFNFDPRL